MVELLTQMQHESLRELHDMPHEVVDPHWMETLEEGESS
jgi:hypothetical protein